MDKKCDSDDVKKNVLNLSNDCELKVNVSFPPEKKKEKSEFWAKIESMFNTKSKLSKMVNESVILNYKKTYKYLLDRIENHFLPVHEDYFCGNALAGNIYKNKYYLKNTKNEKFESRPEHVFLRISAFMAAVEKDDELMHKWAEKFYLSLYEGYFLPGGRVLAGAGDLFRLKTLANCFVSVIENDSLEGIYKAAYEAARTQSFGGGIGIDISPLRPRHSKVHNAADTSTGAVSFMDLFSMTAGLIGQEGRRGAMMLTIDVKHPDVIDFIKVKRDPNWMTQQILDKIKMDGLTDDRELARVEKTILENIQVRFANISIKTSDEFMSAVEEENKYGKDKVLVYKKLDEGVIVNDLSCDDYNYSYGMSQKDLNNYELLSSFESIIDLNSYLETLSVQAVEKDDLDDILKRDYNGDFVLTNTGLGYDIAVRYSGDFMTYYSSKSTGTIRQLHKARDIWNLFIEGNYKTAEPGLIFWSQMTKYSPSNYVGRKIACTNPCGEVPIEDGGACNLGSVNLSRMVREGYTDNAKVDWNLLENTVSTVVRFQDNVVWWNETLNALDKQRDAAYSTRRIGIGVMGIADMFNQLGIGYDSEEGVELLRRVLNHMTQNAYKTSAYLAEEKGSAPCFDYEKYVQNPFFVEVLGKEVKDLVKEKGLRNIAIMSIAPTGTISNAVCSFKVGEKNYMGVSGGIEPIFALYYTRRTEQADQGAIYKIFHTPIQAYIDMKGLNDKIQGLTDEGELRKILPEHFFRTAHHITPDMRIKIQGCAQTFIDHSISSTVNLAEDIEPEVISDIYLKAWKNKLKGITVYRDGSRYPILSIEGQETDFQRFKEKKFKVKDGSSEKVIKGDEVILDAKGRLTTLYHIKKERAN